MRHVSWCMSGWFRGKCWRHQSPKCVWKLHISHQSHILLWRHQMDTFSVLLDPLWGESACHRDAGDLRRHRAHYDVTVTEAIESKVQTYACFRWVHNVIYWSTHVTYPLISYLISQIYSAVRYNMASSYKSPTWRPIASRWVWIMVQIIWLHGIIYILCCIPYRYTIAF